MEQLYSLLRNNKTTGPFSFNQLTQQNLATTDLVWLEGKSMSWAYAGEIEALKGSVSQVVQMPDAQLYEVEEEDLQLVVKYKKSLDELRAEYSSRTEARVRRMPVPVWKNETVSLLVVLAVVVISFFVTSDQKPAATNQLHNTIVQVNENTSLQEAAVSRQ